MTECRICGVEIEDNYDLCYKCKIIIEEEDFYNEKKRIFGKYGIYR